MDYESNTAVKMIGNGKHQGIISRVSEWNNPSGPNKLIVEIDLEEGIKFGPWFTPGFEAFDNLIEMTGEKPQSKGKFDETKLLGKMVELETKITTGNNGNDYCNVVSIKEVKPFAADDKKKA